MKGQSIVPIYEKDTEKTNEELEKLINKFGIRYVIRNFKLTDDICSRITKNEFSNMYDEEDISKDEIREFQKKFDYFIHSI